MDQNRFKKIIWDVLKIHQNLRKSPEAYGILLVNLLILGMVIFMESNRYLVIAAYFFETLAIGMFNVIKMLIISFFSPAINKTQNTIPVNRSEMKFSSPLKANLFLVVFFILHFSIFYFVQLGLLVGVADGLDDNFPGTRTFLPNPVAFFRVSLGDQGMYTIWAIILMQVFSLVYGFLLKGEYKVTNCLAQAVQPYGRIFMQQFVVLIGGFFIIIVQNVAVYSCLLIIFKTFLDIYAQKRHDTKILTRLTEK